MNKEIVGYIASCFPNGELREKRVKTHNQQLDFWAEKTDIKMYVVAIQYEPHEYRKDLVDQGRVEYLIQDRPTLLPEARKICLDHFYASTWRWCMLMDNDAALYHSPTHNSGADFVLEMSQQIGLYDRIGMIYPHNPMVAGFRGAWEEKPDLFQNCHVFDKGFAAKGTLVFLRNFPQFGQTPIHKDPNINWMEDVAFAFDVLAAGHPVVKSWNMVLKELVPAGPLSFYGDISEHSKHMRKANEALITKYGHLGLKFRNETSHSLDTKMMVAKCWPPDIDRRIIIPKPGKAYVEPSSLVAEDLFG